MKEHGKVPEQRRGKKHFGSPSREVCVEKKEIGEGAERGKAESQTS